ncbi:MAG: aspartate aminotransferase family protein, partial [Candidatus Zixiibacteriota bacterium]
MTRIDTLTSTKTGFTAETDEKILKFESKFGAHHYGRVNLVVRRARAQWLYNMENRRYLDCLSAYSAVNQGHHHPEIVRALITALEDNYASVISNVVYTDSLGIFLNKLANLVPQLGPRFGQNGNKVLLKNGGVESVVTAIKMGRCYGYQEKGIADGQQEVICFENNFHGRDMAAISMSSNKKYKEGFGPLTPGFVTVPFGDLAATEKAINKNTCAILIEPCQGEGGMYIPPAGFLKGLREICDRQSLFLIFDEIQVGLGRTGKMFAFEHEGIVPDGIILGKALSGGLVPVSAFVTNSKMMDLVFQPGRDGSTFGGYPLACVAGAAALTVLAEENLTQNALKMGQILKRKIDEVASRSKHVKEVRGRGLFIGIEVKNGDAMAFCRKLLDLDMLCNDSHGHT